MAFRRKWRAYWGLFKWPLITVYIRTTSTRYSQHFLTVYPRPSSTKVLRPPNKLTVFYTFRIANKATFCNATSTTFEARTAILDISYKNLSLTLGSKNGKKGRSNSTIAWLHFLTASGLCGSLTLFCFYQTFNYFQNLPTSKSQCLGFN